MKIREIEEGDLPAVIALFAYAFPLRRPTYWRRGFDNMRVLPAIPGHARYGFLFEADNKVQAVLLALGAQVGDTCRRINLSAWCAHPTYRMMGGLLHAKVMKQKAESYLNLSPAEHVIPMLEPLGFKPYTGGVCLIDGRAALRTDMGSRLIPYDPAKDNGLTAELAIIAERHYRYGCTVLMLYRGSAPAELVIYRTKWIKGVLPCGQVICGAPERVLAAAGPLMRYLLKRGIALALVDIIEPCDMIGTHTFWGRSLRYSRGTPPAVGDLLDSEFALFGP
jgi:hypothetical protein